MAANRAYPRADHRRHVSRKLPRHAQTRLDRVEIGAVQNHPIGAGAGRQDLMRAPERQNRVRDVRWRQEALAQCFSTDAGTGVVDQTPHRHPPHPRRWHDLEIVTRCRVQKHAAVS